VLAGLLDLVATLASELFNAPSKRTNIMKLSGKLSPLLVIIWHIGSALAFTVAVSMVRLGGMPQTLSGDKATFLGYILIAYAVGALLLLRKGRRDGKLAFLDVVFITLGVFAVLLAWLLLGSAWFDRWVLLGALAWAVISNVIIMLFPGWLISVLIAAVAAAGYGAFENRDLIIAMAAQMKQPERQPELTHKTIYTELFDLRASIYKNYLPKTTNGGGLQLLGDGYLLANGSGGLFWLSWDEAGKRLQFKQLSARVPINYRDFIADNGNHDAFRFRVNDILLQEDGERFRLYASYQYWNRRGKCSEMRIAVANGDSTSLVAEDKLLRWHQVYATSPCLPVTKGHNGELFTGADSGGRMLMLGKDQMLFTVGDYQFDGVNRDVRLAQQDDGDYGKTLLIDLSTGTSRVYTKGHRNPQGLIRDADGNILITEHGPQGGDELNVLREGANYGWPNVTLGTAYNEQVWPLNPEQGRHNGYELPIYAWVPSIATSALLQVKGDGFPLWKGDLLVGSYKRSMRRVRMRDGRVIFEEPIMLKQRSGRIRDMLEDRQGRLLVRFDTGSLGVFEAAGDNDEAVAESGESLFAACAACHVSEQGKAATVGPSLFGVAGRAIGTADGYEYSDAMRQHGGEWTAKDLDAFLSGPSAYVPGNKMYFEGIKDTAQRRKLIDYLQGLK